MQIQPETGERCHDDDSDGEIFSLFFYFSPWGGAVKLLLRKKLQVRRAEKR